MKILKLNAYAYPEQYSSLHLDNDLEEGLVKSGFNIVKIVPIPTRSVSSNVRNKYIKNPCEMALSGAIRIVRFPLWREGNNSFCRAIRYIALGFQQVRYSKHEIESDVIFANSTPPTQGLFLGPIKRFLNAAVIYNIQDMFPDSLVSTGLSKKNSLLWKIGNLIANKSYSNADVIVVISDRMKRELISRGVSKEKISVIPNWVDTEVVYPVSTEENPLYTELNLSPEKKYIVYAGNIGESQNIEILIKAASRLESRKDINFLIFGDGSRKNTISELIKKHSLDNTKLFALRPINEVKNVYSLATVALISCNEGTGCGAFPSKTWSILASGTPILASYDSGSDLTNLIEREGLGLCSDAGDLEALIMNIEKAVDDVRMREEMSKRARYFMATKMNKEENVQKYVEVIRSVIAHRNK